MTRTIQPAVRKRKLGADTDGEKRSYWSRQSPQARIAEVESLRRMWIQITGDPDQPIARVICKRKLGG